MGPSSVLLHREEVSKQRRRVTLAQKYTDVWEKLVDGNFSVLDLEAMNIELSRQESVSRL